MSSANVQSVTPSSQTLRSDNTWHLSNRKKYLKDRLSKLSSRTQISCLATAVMLWWWKREMSITIWKMTKDSLYPEKLPSTWQSIVLDVMPVRRTFVSSATPNLIILVGHASNLQPLLVVSAAMSSSNPRQVWSPLLRMFAENKNVSNWCKYLVTKFWLVDIFAVVIKILLWTCLV